jgi:hypothetical protein
MRQRYWRLARNSVPQFGFMVSWKRIIVVVDSAQTLEKVACIGGAAGPVSAW